MNRLIDKFANEVETHNNSFLIDCDEKNYLFTQVNIGSVRLIYGNYAYNTDFLSEAIGNNLELKAVYSDGKIYIMDLFFFGLRSYFANQDCHLPENVVFFYNAVNEVNKYASEKLFNEFYEKLEVKDIPDKSIKEKARKIQLSLVPEIQHITHENIFSENDIIKSMSGSLDIETEANRIFEEEKEDWIETKSRNAKISELIAQNVVAEPWEVAIAEGLRSVPNAKSVMVTFQFKSKTAAEKIEPHIIFQILRDKSYFGGYDFCSAKKGDILLNELNANGHFNDNNCLKCKHIVKITYGKNDIYIKKED